MRTLAPLQRLPKSRAAYERFLRQDTYLNSPISLSSEAQSALLRLFSWQSNKPELNFAAELIRMRLAQRAAGTVETLKSSECLGAATGPLDRLAAGLAEDAPPSAKQHLHYVAGLAASLVNFMKVFLDFGELREFESKYNQIEWVPEVLAEGVRRAVQQGVVIGGTVDTTLLGEIGGWCDVVRSGLDRSHLVATIAGGAAPVEMIGVSDRCRGAVLNAFHSAGVRFDD